MSVEMEDEEKVYDVEKNEFGHPQTYLLSQGKEYPVCCCCSAAVMPNRGQGTACTTCQDVAENEMRLDYEDGTLY